MRVVIQRVKEAKVTVGENGRHKCRPYEIIGRVKKGMLVLLGVEEEDNREDADYLAQKIADLRIFEDNQGKINLSVKDIKGEVLVVPEFTLLANCSKGNRPSLNRAANPKIAQPLYEYFIKKLEQASLKVEKGKFGATMEVNLVNDGPVTFILDSRNRE
jgi:D-tyrosyl-tRNA(Tyr) deacylase